MPEPWIATVSGGMALMSNDWTCATTPAGNCRALTFASTAASVALTSVPKENEATTIEMLLTELELMCWMRGTLPMDRSTGSVICVETSWALAPGIGVITTM